MPRKIILDTNFLLIPSYFGIDILSEVPKIYPGELCVLEDSLEELSKLVSRLKGSEKTAAEFAKKLVEQTPLRIIKSANEGSTDTKILKYSKEHGCLVATQDKELKRRLRKEGIPVIILRQKKYLQLSP